LLPSWHALHQVILNKKDSDSSPLVQRRRALIVRVFCCRGCFKQ
jgi:hypothetical protein